MIVHEHLDKLDILKIANGLADLGGFKAINPSNKTAPRLTNLFMLRCAPSHAVMCPFAWFHAPLRIGMLSCASSHALRMLSNALRIGMLSCAPSHAVMRPFGTGWFVPLGAGRRGRAAGRCRGMDASAAHGAARGSCLLGGVCLPRAYTPPVRVHPR